MNTAEKTVLEFLKIRELATLAELNVLMQREQISADGTLGSLRSKGYIDNVQNLGNCIVITKIGIRALKNGD